MACTDHILLSYNDTYMLKHPSSYPHMTKQA